MQFVRCGMTNFLSYYGENLIEFGLTTIILGQNNTGKSKLFDAINWVLFGRAYHTESEIWKTTQHWKLGGLDLISRRALLEAQEGAVVAAKVTLRIQGDEGAEYEFQRTLSTEVVAEGGWAPCAETVVAYIDTVTGDTKFFEGERAVEAITELVRPNLQPYFLFQGESVSQLLKLSDKNAYGKAIREMARIDVLETTESACKLVKDTMNRRLRSIKSVNEQERAEKEQVGQEIERLEMRSDEARAKKKEHEETFHETCQRIEEIQEELSRSEEYKEKLDRMRGQELVLEEKRKRYKTHRQEASKRVSDWLSIPAASLLDEFHTMFNRLSKAKVVPQPVQEFYLKDILENSHCKVCNRPLNDDAMHHVYSMLQSIEGRQSVDSVMQLAALVGTDIQGIRRSTIDLNDWKVKEAELYDEVTGLDKRIAQMKTELDDVRPSLETDDALKERFDLRKREAKRLENQAKDSEFAIRRINDDLQQWSLRVKELHSQMRKLTSGSDSVREVWTADVSERLHATAAQLREKYSDRIVRGIEEKANQYFKEMTSENRAAVGDLKMDLNTGGVYMVDHEEQPIENVNQATRVSMQLSFVAGLLHEAGDALGVTFPFIADAPVSSLGGDNKLAAIRAMARAFDQAVIILKDDVTSQDTAAIDNDPVRSFIGTQHVDKAYLLEMSEGDANTQYTTVLPLKE